MRYEKGHKETTRRRIVEAASSRFRREGIEAVGVAGLMAGAGLTHGGFYSHFSSKEELVRQAVDEASARSRERFDRWMTKGGLEHWIRYYLSAAHRDHPENGCVAAALAPELGRHSKTTRATFTKTLDCLLSIIESHLPKTQSPKVRRRTARALFSVMVGALQLARTVSDSELSEEILDAGIAAAFALIKENL